MARKILIADDNRQIRMLVSAALRSGGYDLIEAEDGEAAVEKAISNHPDLILLDVTMPKLDGFEVLHLLRRRSEVDGVRVVMLTTAAQQKDLERGRVEGADDYITKPFDPVELRKKVESVLA